MPRRWQLLLTGPSVGSHASRSHGAVTQGSCNSNVCIARLTKQIPKQALLGLLLVVTLFANQLLDRTQLGKRGLQALQLPSNRGGST